MTSRVLRKEIKKYNHALKEAVKLRNEAERYLILYEKSKYDIFIFSEYDLNIEKFRACDEQIDKILKEKKRYY